MHAFHCSSIGARQQGIAHDRVCVRMCPNSSTLSHNLIWVCLYVQLTGEDNWVVPASRVSAPSNRIWSITILRSPKQQIWLRTALCGGWCRRMALRNRVLHARNDDDDGNKLQNNIVVWRGSHQEGHPAIKNLVAAVKKVSRGRT